MLFCSGLGRDSRDGIGYQYNFMAFNKCVSQDRWEEILNTIQGILGINFKLELNTHHWSDEWKRKVSNKQWREILSIPEADKEVIEKIVGFKLELDDTVEIIVEGKKTYISRESAKALNLI